MKGTMLHISPFFVFDNTRGSAAQECPLGLLMADVLRMLVCFDRGDLERRDKVGLMPTGNHSESSHSKGYSQFHRPRTGDSIL